MRTLLSRLFILGVILVFFGGCNLESQLIKQITIGKTTCPQYDVIFGVMTPFGVMTLHMDKGNFNEENHSLEQFEDATGWISLEEYKVWIKELQKKQIIKKGSI